MFDHILVPLDGSRLAEAALPAAVYLADKLGSSITLIHIIERNAPEEVHSERHLTEVNEAKRYLRDLAKRALPHGQQVRTHVHTAEVTDVARSLVEHTQELEPDLIVMCTHGRSGARDWLFGSIAQQVVSMGKIPVLLVRPALEQPQPAFGLRQMLVPLDGKPVHSECIPMAADLARRCGATLRLVTVVPTLETLGGTHAAAGKFLPAATRALLDLDQTSAETYLDEVASSLQPDIAVSREVTRGDPAPGIVAEAVRLGVDLIVLATHGTVGTEAFWARSVPPKVSGHTRIPVLFVPVSDH
jgi:nucleotide-binding universal stress UspA family protein